MEVGRCARRFLTFQPHHHLRLRFAPFALPSLCTIKSPNSNFSFLSNPNLGLLRAFRCSIMVFSAATLVQVKDKIDLSEKERQIFDRLLQVLRHFNLQTQLRVAGGWVRDKLLGKECCDIDIALDNMMGREFCEKVNEYLSSTGEEVQGIGVIQCNPDQSKHLETARMRLFDIWIDFVNLRSESYSENSRIPTMIPLVSYIFRNSLKLKVSDAETVINLHNASERFRSLIPFIMTNEDTENIEVDFTSANLDVLANSRLRIMTGLLLREIKGFWRVALLMSALIYPKELDQIEGFQDRHVQLEKSKELYRRAENIISELGLDNVWEMKPLVNGKDIMNILQLKTGGPQVREWQQKLFEWQLAHPSATAEECLHWMKQNNSKRTKLSDSSDSQ